MIPKPAYLWDVALSNSDFLEILAGKRKIGRLDQNWAALRVLDYASYHEIIQLIGFPRLIAKWPIWRKNMRSTSRKRGIDFLAKWLPEKHPEFTRE